MNIQVLTLTAGGSAVIRIDHHRVQINERVFEAQPQPESGYSCAGCAFDVKVYDQALHRACDGVDCAGVIYKEVL